MAIALVNQASDSQSSGTSLAITIAAPTNGNALVVITGQNAAAVSSISGGGVTWVKLKSAAFSFYASEIWYGENVSSGGTTVTITYASSTRAGAICAEFSGVKTTSSADASTNSGSGTSTSPSAGSVDPASAPALYLAGFTTNGTYSGGAGGGFTAFTDPSLGGGVLAVRGAYRIDNAAHGAQTGSATLTASVSWEASGGALLGTASASSRRDAMGMSGFYGV